MSRTYSELLTIKTYEGRFEYLKLDGSVGRETFGSERYLNQAFYRSKEWRRFRRQILIRDDGCDLAIPGRDIFSRVIIHHLEPLRPEDLARNTAALMDPENVVCVAYMTHQAIHYGDSGLLCLDPIVRRPNDTCPWKEA